MEQQAFDFGRAVDKFVQCLRELHVQVHGGTYKAPDGKEYAYHGVNYANEVRALLEDSTKVKLSYVALRNAERIITDVQEIRFNALIIKTELKAVLNRPELNKNPQASGYYRTLKDIMDKVVDYLAVCDSQYSFMTEILFGASQINISINRRFFNGEDTQYMYKEPAE